MDDTQYKDMEYCGSWIHVKNNCGASINTEEQHVHNTLLLLWIADIKFLDVSSSWMIVRTSLSSFEKYNILK